jgi:hypothetical protein
MFDDIVDKIRHLVELDARGIEMARRSSDTHVKAELQVAASLRWLAGASYLCIEDTYILNILI